jgi:hypothetical protein
MFSKKKMRLAAVAVVSLACVALVAGSASAAVQTNGSDGGVYIYDVDTALAADNTSFLWTSAAYGSSSRTDAGAVITCPSDSTGVRTFVSAVGSERVLASHKAYAASAFVSGTKGVAYANIKLSSLTNGAGAGVKADGGSYSLGVACLKDAAVNAAFYRTISVTAGTGSWTATDSVATDEFRFSTQPASQTVAVGSNVTFTAATSGTPAQSAIKWEKAESTATGSFSPVSAATSGTLTVSSVSDADNGDIYRAVATNSAGDITSSSAVLTVSATTGNVTMNADVINAQDGTLSLSVVSGATVNFAAATLGSNNTSISTGTLPNITVNDGRVHTRPGWSLSASVSDFSFSSNTINKAQLGLVPAKVSATAAGTQAGATQVAGSAVYPAVIATGTAANAVGNTVLNGALTFVAPQEKPAGTYTSTMTLTVMSYPTP